MESNSQKRKTDRGEKNSLKEKENRIKTKKYIQNRKKGRKLLK